MEKAASRTRKRQSSESASEGPHSEVPPSKKKKTTKEKHVTIADPPSRPLYPADTSAELPSKAAPGPTCSSGTAPTRPKHKSKNFYMKSHSGSWLTHIASLVVHQCISQAVEQTLDPRQHLHEINWEVLTGDVLSPDDLQLIWYYISKEFATVPLGDVLQDLQPYSALTVEEFVREGIKQKYKDQIPKPPLSPYMLFCKSKGPKLKLKHPELLQPNVAIKLGKKWKTMGAEKQEKYKQQQAALKKTYDAEIEQFYAANPEARLAPLSKKSTKRGQVTVKKAVVSLSEEERIAIELRAVMPKPPPSAYLLFCKAKREKLHRKHKELSPRDVTVKLAKRWKSIGVEGQAKYKRNYEQNKLVYHQQIEEFHQTHPEARDILKRNKKKPTSKAIARATKALSTSTSAVATSAHSAAASVAIQPSPLPPLKEEEEEEEEGDSDGDLQLDLGHQNGTGASSSSNGNDSGSSDEDDED